MDQSRKRTNSRSSCLHLMALALAMLGFAGCGGGGGSQSGPPPTADFNLSLNPRSASLNGGSSASVNLTVNALNGFNSQVSVQISGLPAGVSVPSASVTLPPGTPQQ